MSARGRRRSASEGEKRRPRDCGKNRSTKREERAPPCSETSEGGRPDHENRQRKRTQVQAARDHDQPRWSKAVRGLPRGSAKIKNMAVHLPPKMKNHRGEGGKGKESSRRCSSLMGLKERKRRDPERDLKLAILGLMSRLKTLEHQRQASGSRARTESAKIAWHKTLGSARSHGTEKGPRAERLSKHGPSASWAARIVPTRGCADEEERKSEKRKKRKPKEGGRQERRKGQGTYCVRKGHTVYW